MRRAPDTIWTFAAPIVESLEYEFIGASLGQTESGLTLRIYIDHDNGVGVDDCGKVSNLIGAGLDVEDLIAGEYCLEVSSPGVRRPLFSASHFAAQTGNEIKVRLTVPQDGRRNFKGTLTGVEGEQIVVEIDGAAHSLNIADIDSANLVPDFD
ncbi:MAG: ribosome maturation factor RimP [Pseudomonadota bacterium]